MPKIHSGVVVGKAFRPPEGANRDKWCYLIVDLSDDERVAVRLHQSKLDAAAVGDRITFNRPSRPERRVRYLQRR